MNNNNADVQYPSSLERQGLAVVNTEREKLEFAESSAGDAASVGAVLSSSQANQVSDDYPSWHHIALIVSFMRFTRRRYGSNYKDRVVIAREAANQHFEKSKNDMLAKRDMLPRLSFPRRYLVILSFYSDSFLSSIGSRFFDLSYGIS